MPVNIFFQNSDRPYVMALLLLFFSGSMFGKIQDAELRLLNCPDKNIDLLPDSILASSFNARHLYHFSEDTIAHLYCYALLTNDKYLEVLTVYKYGKHYKDKYKSIEEIRNQIILLETSIDMAIANGFSEIALWGNSALCSIFTANRMFNQANHYADEFLTIVKNNPSLAQHLTEGYMMKGRILRDDNKLYEADSVLNLAVNSFTSETPIDIIAFTYLHLSYAYKIQNRIDLAYKYAELGFETGQMTGFLENEFSSFFGSILIECHITRKEIDLAEEWLRFVEKSIALNKTQVIRYYFLKGRIESARKNWEGAISAYLTAINYAEEYRGDRDVLMIVDSILSIMEFIDEKEKYIEKINDVARASNENLLAQNNLDYLFKETYYNLEMERDNTYFLSSELRSSKQRTYLLLGLLVMIIILTAMLMYHYRSKQKNNEKTKRLNRQLELANNELKASNKALEDFAFITANKIKSPLRRAFLDVDSIANSDSLQPMLKKNRMKSIFSNLFEIHDTVEKLVDDSLSRNDVFEPENID